MELFQGTMINSSAVLVMVTTKSLRHFAAAYPAQLHTDNPSQRQTMVDAARAWTRTAEAIERYVENGRGTVVPDLKRKLN